MAGTRYPTRAVALLSGGLDSVTLTYDLWRQGYDLHLLSFDYGQRHLKEIAAASHIADLLGSRHHTISLGVRGINRMPDPLARVLGTSSLTSATPVPNGHYASTSMKATVVPNRNAIMLSIAYGIAVAEKADLVAFAAHAGDHAIYPDCRPGFVQSLSKAFILGNTWGEAETPVPVVLAPYILDSKADIAFRALELGVPVEKTWSCYKGGSIHCGTCGTCYERREALALAGAQMYGPNVYVDPTPYLDATTTFEAP